MEEELYKIQDRIGSIIFTIEHHQLSPAALAKLPELERAIAKLIAELERLPTKESKT